MAKKLLNPLRIVQIRDLFSEREWDDYSITENNTRFNNFCSSFGELEEKEFQLIMDLTRRFHTLTFVELLEEFFTGYYSVPETIYSSSQHLIIVPMKKMRKNGYCVKRQKSGDMLMAQMMQMDDICYYREKFIYCKNARAVARHFNQGDVICFIDDFVGTGGTFHDAYNSTRAYLSTRGIHISTNDVIGITAWAMTQGINYCHSQGLRLFCYKRFIKEITDYYPAPENIAHKGRMLNIEREVCDNLPKYLHLGYGKCEALVSIAGRCANNTFPVYWKTKKATFPR